MGINFFAVTHDNERFTFPSPVNASMRLSADSLVEEIALEFLSTGLDADGFVGLEAEENGNLLCFMKITRIETFSNGSARTIRITGHSIAYIMQRSEAVPQVYNNPLIDVLWQRHARPYGSTGFKAEESGAIAPSGQLTVSKGMSDWDVLRLYYRDFRKCEPRIDVNRILAEADIPTGIARNPAANQIIARSFSVDCLKPVSEVLIRAMDGGYEYSVANDDLPVSAPFRRRCINYQQDVPFPPEDARKILRDSLRNALTTTLASRMFIGNIGDIIVSFDGIITDVRYNFNGREGGVWKVTISGGAK